MNEAAFRSELIAAFNKSGNPEAFIWAHDAHFRSGFPDLYWCVKNHLLPVPGGHAELKVWKEEKLPSNPRALCSKIQLHVMGKMVKAGARVSIVILHAPKKGPKVVWHYPLHPNDRAVHMIYDQYLREWTELTKIKLS